MSVGVCFGVQSTGNGELTVVNGVRGFRLGLCFRKLHLIRGTSLLSGMRKRERKGVRNCCQFVAIKHRDRDER